MSSVWEFGRTFYTEGRGALSTDNFEECNVDMGICEIRYADLQVDRVLADNMATRRASLVNLRTNETLSVEVQGERAPLGLLGRTGISGGYYIQYSKTDLDRDLKTLDLITKSLKANDKYAITYVDKDNGSENTFVFLKTISETIKIAEGTNSILDPEHKTIIFNNLGAIKPEDMGVLYFYDISTKKITSKDIGGRLTGLKFSEDGNYLFVGNGSSITQGLRVYKYPEFTKVGEEFVSIGDKEINGQIYFTSLFEKPSRNRGNELDPYSTGIYKFDLATGKVTLVKAPTETKDYNIYMLDENGNLKE